MEPVHGANKASKFASEDVIAKMPENVITSILNRLPIRDAVRTSILSKNWRFKWTLLTKLVFDYESSEYQKNISRLLLHIKGPITKFVLSIPKNILLDVEDINHWVLFLSTKGIKELRIINMHETPLKLPTHLFSCLELTHLKLHNCYLHSALADFGFPNILTLHLDRVTFGSGECGKLITRCHLVQTLIISCHKPIEKVKLAEIATLKNLKVLNLLLRDNMVITCSDIFELGNFLPNLEEFRLNLRHCRFLAETGTRKWVSTSFPRLELLAISSLDFGNASMLSCAFKMIWGSPNLKALRITAAYKDTVAPPPAFGLSEKDNHTLEQPQLCLVYVVFYKFRGSENEVYLIKSILACSPLLQTMYIHPNSTQMFGGENGKLLFATKLLTLHRASPAAEIKLC